MKISRVSSKGQVTLPKQGRDAIGVGPGDAVAYDVVKGVVTLRRLEPIDLAFHATAKRRPDHAQPGALKIFTLDNRFIARRIGVLSARDQPAVGAQLHDCLPGRSQ